MPLRRIGNSIQQSRIDMMKTESTNQEDRKMMRVESP
jgi:hypothetical protein